MSICCKLAAYKDRSLNDQISLGGMREIGEGKGGEGRETGSSLRKQPTFRDATTGFRAK